MQSELDAHMVVIVDVIVHARLELIKAIKSSLKTHFQSKAEFMEPDLSWGDIKICRNCSSICPNATTCSRRKNRPMPFFSRS